MYHQCLPLPTQFSNKQKQDCNPKKHIFNPMNGWMDPKNHPCKLLYDMSKPYIKSFDLALDIGCRFGEFTYFSQKDFTHTFCFDPVVYEDFCTNADLSKSTHYKCALGNEFETIKMYGGCHHNSLDDGKQRTFLKSTKHYAQSVPLDSFLLTTKYSNIGLIKIDVEGFEFNVLRGGWSTIINKKPVVIIEQNSIKLNDQEDNAALKFLLRNGYSIKGTSKNSKNVITDYVLAWE